MYSRLLKIIISLFVCCIISASCTYMVPTSEITEVNDYNEKSYEYRYINIDSSLIYAQKALEKSSFYNSGKAEAINNLAFCKFMHMQFEEAEFLHKQVYSITQNELELFIADVGLMKIYQRVAMNERFYECKNSAEERMKRISEDINLFSHRHDKKRVDYAFSEYYIVSAIYYYYLNLRDKAIEEIDSLDPQHIKTDLNQLLYYNYVKGSASLIYSNNYFSKKLSEFDLLYSTWELSKEKGIIYFEANALQGIANLISHDNDFRFYKRRRLNHLENIRERVDSLTSMSIAQEALEKFKKYKDEYQVAGTYVTIAKRLNNLGEHYAALDTLRKSLDCVNKQIALNSKSMGSEKELLMYDKITQETSDDCKYIEQAGIKGSVPEWIGRIREQLSISYAGIGNLEASYYNRNVYLDLLDYTRQNKELESRYTYLKKVSNQIKTLTGIIFFVLAVMILLWNIFRRRIRKKKLDEVKRIQDVLHICKEITSSIPIDTTIVTSKVNSILLAGRINIVRKSSKYELEEIQKLSKDDRFIIKLIKPYLDWAYENETLSEILDDEQINIEKKKYVYENHIEENKRNNIEKKACLSIVNGITPYIDRILNELNKLTSSEFSFDKQTITNKYNYIDELTDKINEYNEILSLWIKMKQGSISLNIETFRVEEVFQQIRKSTRTFKIKNQEFSVAETDAVVKADKSLTLFMLNTLSENARKYTPEKGRIEIDAEQTDTYTEISVKDNGYGLSDEDVKRITQEKVYDSKKIGADNLLNAQEIRQNKGNGFGIMNSKGIIEKYKKTNKIFNVCTFGVESQKGKGSRFFFRLPNGVSKTLSILLLCYSLFSCNKNTDIHQIKNNAPTLYEEFLDEASYYAERAYFSNVDKEYEQTLMYIDSAMVLINRHKNLCSSLPLKDIVLFDNGKPSEIDWFTNGFDSNYHIILDIRNEAAISMLALGRFDEYSYNNSAYSELYKLNSEDKMLETDCLALERSNSNKRVAIILIIGLFLIVVIIYYSVFIKRATFSRANLEQILEINNNILIASSVQDDNSTDRTSREDKLYKQIPANIVKDALFYVNELVPISVLAIGMYNSTKKILEYSSNPDIDMPEEMELCFSTGEVIKKGNDLFFPLTADTVKKKDPIGVVYFRKSEFASRETNTILLEFISRYMGIALQNSVVKFANQYRDIELANEETARAQWEGNTLHIQNMVLDNCLSTIKHETLYYPSKIKQLVENVKSISLDSKNRKEQTEAIKELAEYYKEIFTTLSLCAVRQTEEATFKRRSFEVSDIMQYAERYFAKRAKKVYANITFSTKGVKNKIIGDKQLICFLIENLINESLLYEKEGELSLKAESEDNFIRFSFYDKRREFTQEELNELFYPDIKRMTSKGKNSFGGTEFLICKQIIREHDEYAGIRGCRINAKSLSEAGFMVFFTLPKKA